MSLIITNPSRVVLVFLKPLYQMLLSGVFYGPAHPMVWFFLWSKPEVVRMLFVVTGQEKHTHAPLVNTQIREKSILFYILNSKNLDLRRAEVKLHNIWVHAIIHKYFHGMQ